jgi:hypothetical protein
MRKSLFSSIVNLRGPTLRNYFRPILCQDVRNQPHAAIDAVYEEHSLRPTARSVKALSAKLLAPMLLPWKELPASYGSRINTTALGDDYENWL